MTSRFSALLRLQLLSRLADWNPKYLKEKLREKRARTLGMMLAWVVLAVWMIGFVLFIEISLIDALMSIGMPEMLLSMTVMASMICTLVMGFFFIMSSLYFGRDAEFLSSLPIRSRTLLTAKLTQVWLGETGISAIFILPAALLYGIRTGTDGLFYLRAVLVWLCAPLLPMAIVTLLSTVLARISVLGRKRELISTVGGVSFLVLYMLLCARMGSVFGGTESDDMSAFMGDLMRNNAARIEAFTGAFPPAAWAVRGMTGEWGMLLLFLGVSAGAIGLTILLLGKRYQKFSMLHLSAPVSAKKHGNTEKAYRSCTPLAACAKREIRSILRVSTYAVNSLPTAFMPVLMILVFWMSMQNSSDAPALSDLLNGAPETLVLAVMTGMMAFMAGINPACSSAVTREGRSGHAVISSLPLDPKIAVKAKLLVTYGISIVGCVTAVILLCVLLPQAAPIALLAFALTCLYCFVSSCLGLTNDVRKPSLNWLNETEAIKQKANGMWGILISYGLLIVLAILSYLMISANVSLIVFAFALLALLLAGSILAYKLLMRTAEKKYCAENE